jgi:hypothetical protein
MRKSSDARNYRPDTGCVFVTYTQWNARGQPTSYAGEVAAVEADALVEKWEAQGRRDVRIVHSWPNNGTLLTSSCRGLRALHGFGDAGLGAYDVVSILGKPHLLLPDGRRVRPLAFFVHRELKPGVVIVQVAGGGVVQIPAAAARGLPQRFGMRVRDATGGSLVLTGPGNIPQENAPHALAGAFAGLGAVLASGARTSPTRADRDDRWIERGRTFVVELAHPGGWRVRWYGADNVNHWLTPRGEWIVGRGFSDFDEGRFPRRQEIDDATPNHPALVIHWTGQYGIANTRALSPESL